jgi:membrane fusion protein (multidrug efflux system)
MVGLLVAFVVIMVGRINEKKARLVEAKKTAIKKDIEPVSTIVLTLEPRRLVDKIELPGQVEPYEDLWVKAEVSGQVMKVLVEEGQIVTKGAVLVELDERDYRTRLARIEANYSLAKLDHERTATLVQKKVTPVSELDRIEAELKDLASQLNEAQLALSRTKITAPIPGRINEVKAKKGELLAVGQPVAEVLQFDKVKVTVGVPESDVAAVFDLSRADVVIDALDRLRVKGRKIFLSRQPRSLARLYDLELEVPNPDGRILPGMFARIELVKQIFDQALAVPLYAVIAQSDEHVVFLENDGHAENRKVELGVLDGWEVQITSGLKPGDRVIVVGHRFLDDGQPIKVIKRVRHPREILES